MATIKVTNKSKRLYTNVGGKSIIPGETVEVDASAERDIKGNADLVIERSGKGGTWANQKPNGNANTSQTEESKSGSENSEQKDA